jgi:L-aminopeptidase/D-esterase-like protein
MARATKSGLGVGGIRHGDLIVAALVAANPFGQIFDPSRNAIVAGPRLADESYADTVSLMADSADRRQDLVGANTTLAVVATNARLSKAGCKKVAQMAHDGLARTIRPIHTHLDGDAIFALSAGQVEADINLVGALAADVIAAGVLNAAYSAGPAYGLPAATFAMP